LHHHSPQIQHPLDLLAHLIVALVYYIPRHLLLLKYHPCISCNSSLSRLHP
jgi:hypothetical protein